MSFSDFVAKWIYQMAHVGWGAFLTLLLARHIGWYGALAVVGMAAVKEGIFDPATETPGVRGSGWLDFAFWCFGVGLGFVTWRWM